MGQVWLHRISKYFSLSFQRRKVKDFFIKFTKKSHSADFLTQQTLDFVLHRLLGGLAEMHTHDIGCLADLLSDSRAIPTILSTSFLVIITPPKYVKSLYHDAPSIFLP